MAFQTGFSPRQFQALFDVLFGSATVNPATAAAGTEVVTSVTVTGAALGELVLCFPGVDLSSLGGYFAQVTAANTVKIVISNETADHIDLASSTWRFVLLRPKGNFASI